MFYKYFANIVQIRILCNQRTYVVKYCKIICTYCPNVVYKWHSILKQISNIGLIGQYCTNFLLTLQTSCNFLFTNIVQILCKYCAHILCTYCTNNVCRLQNCWNSVLIRGEFITKNGKKNDIVHLSNYPHPPGLIVTAERMTNHIN